jgi:S-phase kinase-associated protein 1
LEDVGRDGEAEGDPVPLPNVNAAILKKFIQRHGLRMYPSS